MMINKTITCIFLTFFLGANIADCAEINIDKATQTADGNKIITNIFDDISELKEKYPQLQSFKEGALKKNYNNSSARLQGQDSKDAQADILSIQYNGVAKDNVPGNSTYIEIYHSQNPFPRELTKLQSAKQFLPNETYISELKLYIEYRVFASPEITKEIIEIVKKNANVNALNRIKERNKKEGMPSKLVHSQDYAFGFACMLSGDTKKAIAYLKNATQRNPYDAESYGLLGDTYSSLGLYEEAEANYLKARKLYRIQKNNLLAAMISESLNKLKIKKAAQGWIERRIDDISIRIPDYLVEDQVLNGKTFRVTDNEIKAVVVLIDKASLADSVKSVISSKYDFWEKTYYPGRDLLFQRWNQDFRLHFQAIQRMDRVDLKELHGFVTKGSRKTAQGDLVYMLDYILFKKGDNERQINIVIQSAQGYFLDDRQCEYIITSIKFIN